MIPDDTIRLDPHWVDVVMQILPGLYKDGNVTAGDDCVLVYAATFAAVGVELSRGATSEAVREQTSRILEYIDGTDRPDYDKEHFASLFARAVDDALSGRAPCILH